MKTTPEKILQWFQIVAAIVALTLAYSDIKHALNDNTKAIQSLVEQLRTVETRMDARFMEFPTKKQTEDMGMLLVRRYHSTNEFQADEMKREIREILNGK